MDSDQVLGRHALQDVDVARDHARLGRDGHRMVEPLQHFQDAARDLEIPLDGLVGVGIGSQRDYRRYIVAVSQLGLEQGGGVVFCVQAGFEVEARRKPQIGMAGPGIAIDAAMLASAVRIDGRVERQVWRLVARNDALGFLREDNGLDLGCLWLIEGLGLIGDPLAGPGVEPADIVRARRPAFQRAGGGRSGRHVGGPAATVCTVYLYSVSRKQPRRVFTGPKRQRRLNRRKTLPRGSPSRAGSRSARQRNR